MRKTLLAMGLISMTYSIVIGQETQDLKIDYMLRGNIYASSSIIDSNALGGFGGSDNLPRKINENLFFADSGLFLKIDTTEATTIEGKYNGYKLFIVNKTDTIARFSASDSRLSVIAEVFYEGEWKPIEYLPSSWCGNSYHHVYLKQNEYWEFRIPKFSGKIKTRLHYKLILGKDRCIYSNEISVSFNRKQLVTKQGHQATGLMDPYND